MPEPIVLFSTCSDEIKAQNIATQLIENHLAACVNIVPGIRSVFRWEGEIHNQSECLLVIKSLRDQVQSIQQLIQELSGYELPELIAMDIVDGSQPFIDWLTVESRDLARETNSE
ncbi:MAG: divalent-cation tolerance protein CutA [Candidatus Zixiibacteriota bacterium]